MRLQRSQRGISALSIAFYLVLLGLAVHTALKLIPIYIDGFAVESSVMGLESDKSHEFRGALDVRNAVIRRFGINNVTAVTKDDVAIIREDNRYLIEVDYEVRVPYMFNIDFVVSFNYQAEVPAS